MKMRRKAVYYSIRIVYITSNPLTSCLMRLKHFPMFLFRENYNLLKIERLNGNNNSEWCSTTFENQNKQQWHVWFMKNHDDEIFENKLLMGNVHHISLMVNRATNSPSGQLVCLLCFQILTLLLQFSFYLVVKGQVGVVNRYISKYRCDNWNQSISALFTSSIGSSFANYFSNKNLLDISRGLHKKRITHMIQFTRDFFPISVVLLMAGSTRSDFMADKSYVRRA